MNAVVNSKNTNMYVYFGALFYLEYYTADYIDIMTLIPSPTFNCCMLHVAF